eukprot:TRINITY_DN23339_c0_g1_i1.p1 TRINITY_DN23339_c0_g1~~TRINITY_DN23339_c0_g1_i1.p1  ORF type:complete len:718 (-),score=87.44 TRINITY_DN23339_c0_g1_i1:313-2466(-)
MVVFYLWVRIFSIWLLPLLTILLHWHSSLLVLILSFLSTCAEACNIVQHLQYYHQQRKIPKRRSFGRPFNIYLINLILLYVAQILMLTLEAFMLRPQDVAPASGNHVHLLWKQANLKSEASRFSIAKSIFQSPPRVTQDNRNADHFRKEANRRDASLLDNVSSSANAPIRVPHDVSTGVFLGLKASKDSKASMNYGTRMVQVSPSEAASFESHVEQDSFAFELDASPESLRWSPKTISVVLPCAEEREFAVKTVQSIHRTTPTDVLQEIIVVDDGSNPPIVQKYLTPDVQKLYKVRVIRHEKTVGLIGAKKTGGDAASGDILVFLDCHVAPQPKWHEDFLRLISENYRRMVVPRIVDLNIDTWAPMPSASAMSKCYLTWDGDFKWGGTGDDDMYMGMLSGGLAGLSRRWWHESGGLDEQMLGWGGENIDQGIRMWVCGGEIVAAPHAEVAHMFRGSAATASRYKRVGNRIYNRARAISAWAGEFSEKLYDYPAFVHERANGGPQWYGGLESFQKVKRRLKGCRPFAWYLRRFKSVYEDAGLIPAEIFMMKDKHSGQCLRYLGGAGTSNHGHESIRLDTCDSIDHGLYWHLGNRYSRSGKCCSGLRAWNTDQCLSGADGTRVCEISGSSAGQQWALQDDGRLARSTPEGKVCLGMHSSSLSQKLCDAFKDSFQFLKVSAHEPRETQLYKQAQRDHPEVFAKLNAQFAALEAAAAVSTA